MNGRVIGKRKKGPQTGNSAKITDLFTVLCRSDLGVECVKEYRFHPVRKWRFDYAIPTHKIALEVEGGVWTGGRHTSSTGFLKDMEKYNTGTLLGWRIFRTTPSELHTRKTLDLIREAIAGANRTENNEKRP
jgi:very-short-patch-repair endonuclease